MKELKELQKAYDEFIESADEIIEKAKKKEKQSKVWKPETGDGYFIVDLIGNVRDDEWFDCGIDEHCYEMGNCFKTEQEAEEVVKKLKIYTELKRLAEELNEEPIDWADEYQNKWRIFYDVAEKRLCIEKSLVTKNIGQIYCTNPDFLKTAKARMGEEKLIKLFE